MPTVRECCHFMSSFDICIGGSLANPPTPPPTLYLFEQKEKLRCREERRHNPGGCVHVPSELRGNSQVCALLPRSMHEGWLLKEQTSAAGGWVAHRPSCGRISYITDCPLKTLLWMPTIQMSWSVHIKQKKSLTQKNYRYTIKCERLVLFSSPSSLPQISWNCSSLEMWEGMVSQRYNTAMSFWSPNLTSVLWYTAGHHFQLDEIEFLQHRIGFVFVLQKKKTEQAIMVSAQRKGRFDKASVIREEKKLLLSCKCPRPVQTSQ